MSVAVVYLVWKPLGLETVQRFVASYRQCAPGHPHDLMMLYNGFDSGDTLEAWEAELEDVPHQVRRVSRSKRDLSAYYEIVDATHYDWYCLLNSYSALMGDGWLDSLMRAATQPDVGLAGATGSWDSLATHRALMSLDSTEEQKRDAVLHYPPFPNFHLRTTGILVRRDRWLAYEPFRNLVDKEAAHRSESGKDGFSQTLLKQGLKLLLVGRDGRSWPHDQWDQSRAFRSGGQDNCLIGDNQTERYRTAAADEQARQREVTWGSWTGMRDQGTWSPMELVRQLDILMPWAHPDMFLPLVWQDSRSDPRLTAELEKTVEWWRELGLPARIEENVSGIPTGALGTVRGHDPFSTAIWVGFNPPPAGLVMEVWQLVWGDAFPTLSCRHGRYGGKPLAFLLCDAAVILRDRTLHELWKTHQRPLSVGEAERVVRGFPDRAQSALLMAAACEAERQWEQAATWYRRSLEFDAGYADGHLGLARCLLALGQPGEAREPVECALRITPLDLRGWKLKWQVSRAVQ